jgi:DNA-binding IclR family transcriptional regulator
MLHKSEQKRKTATIECLNLISKEPLSIKQLSEKLRINSRTCYRVMEDLKKAGYSIAKNKEYLYYIVTNIE